MVTSSAFVKHPDYNLSLRQYEGSVEVWFHGEKIASTRQAIEMSEAEYALVYYIPFADCIVTHFDKTGHSTYCPFKGNASYWSLGVNSEHRENCVWGYEEPYDEVAGIANHVAFYPDKVDVRIS
jgi:uncharacterized protein (DUF427 family)